MVGGDDDGGNGHGLGAGGSMVVQAGVGDAVCVGSRGGVEEGRVVGVAALGYRWGLVEFGLCLSGLDLVEDAVARVGSDALDLPLEAKLAVYERDVVELVECEGEGERGVSGEEVGEVGADATGVLGRRRACRSRGGWERRGGGNDDPGGLDGGRAMSGRVGHGKKECNVTPVLSPSSFHPAHHQHQHQRTPAWTQTPSRRDQA